MRKQVEKKEAGKKDILTGVVAGYCILLVILLLGAAAISRELISETAAAGVACFSAFGGGLGGALIATRYLREKRLLYALGTGGAMCGINLIIRGFSPNGEILSMATVCTAALFLCGGLTAGLFRARKKKKRR